MVYIYVGLAGALGAVLRYAIGLLAWNGSLFPIATFSINLIGSFLLAWLTTFVFIRTAIPDEWKSAIGTGFIGAFTTFSTLSVETVSLFQGGHALMAVLYAALSMIGGLAMSFLGYHAASERKEAK
ncbi:fluoride efflux transporter CrcB [Bacillus sp. 1P06AnD]|uniref:fluoride efflux transporter CrcB n=1 Tax=Bacillus sp. 1P06AnD TaxID=3132208 RepID=UPI0039A1B235